MCLHLTKENKDSFITEDDIICYKQMLLRGGKLLSPYRGHEYTLNKLEESSLNYIEEQEVVKLFAEDYTFYESYAIVQEGLHSFVNQPDVEAYYIKIVKCIIPKGSEVYKGFFSGYESYASNQLIITEILTEELAPNAYIYTPYIPCIPVSYIRAIP